MIPVMIPYWNYLEKNAVIDVMDGIFVNEHNRVREFEKEFAKFVQAKYCVMTTSGSMALYMALQAKKTTIPSTTPRLVPSYMGIFVAHALIQFGQYPEIIDTDQCGLSEKIDSVFYVHANGRIKFDTKIKIEDCCQAISHHTPKAISCYSFAPTKHMTTGGQGGAVCCDDKETYEELSRIKDHGRVERAQMKPVKDIFTQAGTNMKVTELQAGFGLEQLKKLPGRLKRFREIYQLYQDELSVVRFNDVTETKYRTVNFIEREPTWQVDILVDNPDKLIAHLKKNEIMANRLHMPINLQPEFLRCPSKMLVKSQKLYKHGVFLPSTTNLEDKEIIGICKIIKDYGEM